MLDGHSKAKGLHSSVRNEEPTLCPSIVDYMTLMVVEDVDGMFSSEHITGLGLAT